MYKCFRLFSSSCVEKWIAEDNGAAKEMQIRPTLMNPMKAVLYQNMSFRECTDEFWVCTKVVEIKLGFFYDGEIL
jgi:hypothetical protein